MTNQSSRACPPQLAVTPSFLSVSHSACSYTTGRPVSRPAALPVYHQTGSRPLHLQNETCATCTRLTTSAAAAGGGIAALMLEYAVHACTYEEPPAVSLDRSPMHACGSLLLLLLSHALLGLGVDEVHGHVHEHDGAQQQHHRGAGLAAERVRVEHLYTGGHHHHGHTTGRSKGATRYHMSACHVSIACSTAPAGGRTYLGALDLEPVLHHATGAQLQQRREDEGDDEALTGTPTQPCTSTWVSDPTGKSRLSACWRLSLS